MSTTNVKTIKALDGFSGVTDHDVVNRGLSVQTKMTGNLYFPNPPVDLAVLKTDIETLSALMAESLDGSKRVIATKNRQRHVVVKKLRLLGRYVEVACDDDMAIFQTSGFEAASKIRAVTPPLSEKIRKIEHGANSGQLVVWIKSVPGALCYELRYTTATGAVPGEWTTLLVTKGTRKPVILNSLIPGSVYAVQARAVGRDGYTDWTDSLTFMCT
jgi:hypothetical protein